MITAPALTFDWLADLAADAIRAGYDVGQATFDPETGPTVGDCDTLPDVYACLYCGGYHWEADCDERPELAAPAPIRVVRVVAVTAPASCPHGNPLGNCDGCRLADLEYVRRGRARAAAEGRLR